MNPARETDLLVMGEINPDLILQGDVMPQFGQVEKTIDQAELVMGGSAVITAHGAVRLGLRTQLMGLCGDDIFGNFMLEKMKAAGIDITPVHKESNIQTGFTIHLTRPDGDRALLTYLGAIAAFGGQHVDLSWFTKAKHLHIASFFLQENLRSDLPTLIRQAKAAGMTISLDTNWDPSEKWNGNLREILELIDIFLPSRNEAMAIAGRNRLDESLAELSRRVPLIAVKCGADGGEAVNGPTHLRCRPPVVEPVDTTGAGDTFNAGFLAAWLRGLDIATALQAAVVAGSLSTRAMGGTSGQPTWAQLRKEMAQAPKAEVLPPLR